MPATTAQKPWVTTAVLLALLLVLVYGQVSGTPSKARDAVDKTSEVCVAVNEMKTGLVAYIDAQILRARKSLPTIEYYKRHPVELGKALANLDLQREETHARFSPDRC